MSVIPKYTQPAVILHWLIALLIGINLLIGSAVDLTPDSWHRALINFHKSIGITALGLFFVRLAWRMTHTPPALPDDYKVWERRAAHAAHVALYFIMFALPLSGWAHDSAWAGAPTHPLTLFGAIPWFRLSWIMDLDAATKETYHKNFGALHELLSNALYVVLAAHIAGAIKHQWLDKKKELQRMWW